MWTWAINILGFLGGIFKELLQHPIFKKIAFLSIFYSLIIFIIDFFLNTVKANIDLQYFDLIYYLGVAQALQVFIGFAITSYVANHILTYFKSF